jgi:glutaredoxin/glutathione-dependent peroxiredoxin
MTIKIGDRLPEGSLSEFIEVESEGCSLGPNTFNVSELAKGKKIAIFGLPGAYTPTCSAKHVPGYIAQADALKAKGVDEIWCISVNDAFVMGAWGRDQKSGGKVRMMADGSAAYTKKLGLELDLTARGMGVRCQRFSMLVDDGVVKALNIEAPGKFEVSDAETMLKQVAEPERVA